MWGGTDYEVRLLTASRTYFDAAREESRTVVRFGLAFQSVSYSDERWFASEELRQVFLGESFSNLVLEEIPGSQRESEEVVSPLQCVKGEYLSSVTFVMDYVQLDFCGYRFNMYDWPLVTSNGKPLGHTDTGYRDLLCSFIGRPLKDTDEFLDKGLTLDFGDGCINLPLKVPRDFPSPEVAEFTAPKSGWVIWLAGEPPFD